MRTFRMLAIAAAAAGLLATSAAGTASAATTHLGAASPAASVTLKGGRTTVTTAPGIAAALLINGIVPIATLPGTAGTRIGKSGVQVKFAFPVAGGQVSLKPLGGQVRHAGGILFLGLKNGKQISISNFTIALRLGLLTGIVNGNPKARVPVFRLGLAHAKLTVQPHVVTARNVALRLTKVAAAALNATFGTSIFMGGMRIGTAATTLRV